MSWFFMVEPKENDPQNTKGVLWISSAVGNANFFHELYKVMILSWEDPSTGIQISKIRVDGPLNDEDKDTHDGRGKGGRRGKKGGSRGNRTSQGGNRSRSPHRNGSEKAPVRRQSNHRKVKFILYIIAPLVIDPNFHGRLYFTTS